MDETVLTAIDGLARRVQAGDQEAFADLVERCHRPLRLAVAAHCRRADAIDDIAQSAWIEAYRSIATWRAEGSFLSWLIGIARNLIRADAVRARRRRDIPLDGSEVVAPPEVDSERGDERFERWQSRLPGCLDRLAPAARRLIEARYRLGEPLARMAIRFHQRTDRLANTLWRTRTALRRCLEGEAE